MKQTCSIIKNFCKMNSKEVNITPKINETIIIDTQVIVDKFNIFFSKICDQVIGELEKNNNLNVSYKQFNLICTCMPGEYREFDRGSRLFSEM